MTLTFTDDLDMINVHHHTKFGDPNPNGSKDMNLFLVIFFLVNYYLVTFTIVTDRRTDGQTDRQKAAHKSPPCISTGGLKKYMRSMACIAFFAKRGYKFHQAINYDFLQHATDTNFLYNYAHHSCLREMGNGSE